MKVKNSGFNFFSNIRRCPYFLGSFLVSNILFNKLLPFKVPILSPFDAGFQYVLLMELADLKESQQQLKEDIGRLNGELMNRDSTQNESSLEELIQLQTYEEFVKEENCLKNKAYAKKKVGKN